jgi:hypothetical protein
MADTETKPGSENSDWAMFAKSGRDGKDGKPPPGPVKVALR